MEGVRGEWGRERSRGERSGRNSTRNPKKMPKISRDEKSEKKNTESLAYYRD